MLTEQSTLETIFAFGSQLALLGWVVLLLLPRRWKIVFVIPSIVVPVLLSLAYGGLIMVAFFQTDGGNFNTLSGVKQLLSNDVALLAGWFHYLAFDLFVGSVIARKADEIGLSRLVQTPILLLTFLAGPLGYFLFQFTYGGWRLINKPVK